MEFTVASRRQRGGTVLAVVGEFDIATAPEFADVVAAELEQAPPALVVDLTATAFADSSAARALAQAARSCRSAGIAIEVVCPRTNPAVRRVLDLLGLDAVAPVRDDLSATPVAGASRPPGAGS